MNRHLLALVLLLMPALLFAAEKADSVRPPSPATGIGREIPEFKRKIESTVFIPKGQWGAGVSVNYSQSNQSNYQFLIVENLNGDTYSFKVSPLLVYFVRNDMGLGGRFAYSRALTKLEHGDIVIDSKSKRFGLFNEMQLEFGGGQSKLMKGKNEELTGNYARDFHFNIGFAPGMVMFLNNYVAMEVNVGVLGFGLTSTKQIDDRIYESHRKSESANFRINLFSITFGTTFYL